MEQGIATSLYKNDGISADEAQSKRCKVTVQHPEGFSHVINSLIASGDAFHTDTLCEKNDARMSCDLQ